RSSVLPLCGARGAESGDAVMDLGKKLSTPKDIMLEELSLLSNRGSRLFKMRQRRSEKYTFESIQNEANALLNVSHPICAAENSFEKNKTKGPDSQANRSAYMVTEKLDTTPGHKTYHSPWEQVILSDPNLADTLQLRMPEPEPKQDLPEYKCFNRVATPYGGFEKAPRGITFKLPEVDLNPPQYQELCDPRAKRPTFNRTAQGWISEGTHLILPTITLESFSVPESDDL
uniref:Myozenin 2b n=1 Tax=Cyprinodon variegatus TaxID=28743 RepID=A0A3Q2EK44_CYPVA